MRVPGMLRNIMITALGIFLPFFLSLMIQTHLDAPTAIPMLFVFSVFVIALTTQGYLYGTVAAVIDVLAVNYAFTFPYFKINFTIPENLFSAVVMIAIALLTGALTVRLKRQELLRAEGEKERMRANLLRAISHDLRTPLTTIYGSSSALLENMDGFSEGKKTRIIQGIQEDAQWLIGMVENLLSITRIDSGRVKIVKTSTALDELVDAVLVKFKKRYPGQVVELSLPEKLVMIPMDPMLIQQVLTNLLENAVFHAKGMTWLSLSVVLRDGTAIFSVEDDGAGIEKERLDQIFTGYGANPEAAADSQRRNAGIGLSVCATIIKAHGGTICAENRNGGGAAFRFTLTTEDVEHEQQ